MNYTINEIPDEAVELSGTEMIPIWQGETKKVSVATLQDEVVEYVQDTASYSTEETLTGGTWIDGKPIYRQVFTGAMSNGKVLINGGVAQLISAHGIWYSSSTEAVPFPYGSQYVYRTVTYSSTTKSVTVYSNDEAVDAAIVLEYTKTTD